MSGLLTCATVSGDLYKLSVMKSLNGWTELLVTFVIASIIGSVAYAEPWKVTETNYAKIATQTSNADGIRLSYTCGNFRITPVEQGLEPWSETAMSFTVDGRKIDTTGYYEAIIPGDRPEASFGFANHKILRKLVAAAKGDIIVEFRDKDLTFSSEGSAAALKMADSKCDFNFLPF